MSSPFGVNTTFAIAGNQSGRRLDPYGTYNFVVEVDGLLVGGFSRVSGLESSIQVKEYAEGGVNGYVHRIPGETRYPNLVLTQGLTGLDTLYAWYADVTRGHITRRYVSIMLLDARRTPVTWWTVVDAIPVKWIGPSFDASRDGEVAVQSVELSHRGIEKPVEGATLARGRAAGGYLF